MADRQSYDRKGFPYFRPGGWTRVKARKRRRVLQMAEFNEQAGEADKSDIKDIKKLMREAGIYSKWIGHREQNC